MAFDHNQWSEECSVSEWFGMKQKTTIMLGRKKTEGKCEKETILNKEVVQ